MSSRWKVDNRNRWEKKAVEEIAAKNIRNTRDEEE
jgi:hypothetical protein